MSTYKIRETDSLLDLEVATKMHP